MTEFQRKLPPEVRQMIWVCVGIAEPREVFIDHSVRPFKRNIHNRKRFVREKLPILLQICQESRQWALSRYTSFFRLPPPEPWTYTGRNTSIALEQICECVGVPNYQGSNAEMERRLTDFINTGQSAQGVVFAKLGNSAASWGFVHFPIYFNLSTDTLCLKLIHRLYFQPVLWHPSHSPDFSKLRKLAFVLDRFLPGRCAVARLRTGVFGNAPGYIRDPGRDLRMWQLPELEQLSFIITRNREVFRLEIDDQDLLKRGEWAYSLPVLSDDFKDEMGSSWSGVLWKVTLAKEDEECLHQLALKWAPEFRTWECHKMEMYKKNKTAFGKTWRNSPERLIYNPSVQPTPPEQKHIDGGDGKTFLGVSQI